MICFGEVYRAEFSSLLRDENEATWSFGRVFPVTLLLSPVVELILNAAGPPQSEERELTRRTKPEGECKFFVWITRAGGWKGKG